MNHIPARKITNRGSKKNTGFFPSVKNERLIAFESLLELDYIYLLEFDNDVVSYKEQPLTMNYFYLNRTYRYTPDFSVERKGLNQLIEVKPLKSYIKIQNDPKKFMKFRAAANYCKHNGYDEFVVVTEKEIRDGIKLNNIKYLHSYHNLKVPASAKLAVRNELMVRGPMQISQLLLDICKSDVTVSTYTYYAYLLAMLYHHEIKTDLLSPISTESVVSF